MSLRLPIQSTLSLGNSREALLDALSELQGDDEFVQGYVEARHADAIQVLFILKGNAFAAGVFKKGRFEPLPITTFLGNVPKAQKMRLVTTDLPLFLCTAVLFRKAPAAHLPTGLVDNAALLGHLSHMEKDAVLVIRRQDARSLAFCHGGELQKLYPAQGEVFGESGGVADQIIEYIEAQAATEVVLDVYEEIRLVPAGDGGKPLSSYHGRLTKESSLALVVHLGNRAVFRFPISQSDFSIGRGGSNDLSLGNLSISRRHAKGRRVGNNVVLQDLVSENGIKYEGKRVDNVEMKIGDLVEIGKYKLQLRDTTYGSTLPAAPERDKTAMDVHETIGLMPTSRVARLTYKGNDHVVNSPIFTIGSGRHANLRIGGLFVGAVHARLTREQDGTFHLKHVGGRRALLVNGAPVERVQLKDGDEICIGRQYIAFCSESV